MVGRKTTVSTDEIHFGYCCDCCAIGGAVQPVIAEDVTAAVDVNSAYVWRGQTFNDGMVAPPSVDVASGGFGFNVWGNIDIDDYYSTLELGWEYGITEQLSLGLGGSIAYAGEEYCADDSAGLYDSNLLLEPHTQKSPLYALCMQRAFLWAYKGTGFKKKRHMLRDAVFKGAGKKDVMGSHRSIITLTV